MAEATVVEDIAAEATASAVDTAAVEGIASEEAQDLPVAVSAVPDLAAALVVVPDLLVDPDPAAASAVVPDPADTAADPDPAVLVLPEADTDLPFTDRVPECPHLLPVIMDTDIAEAALDVWAAQLSGLSFCFLHWQCA